MNGAVASALGLYISIPFCRSKCTYCNFASGVYPASEHARYIERVIADLAGANAWGASVGAELPRRVDSVYLGGGTPSLLEPELLERLFRAMRAGFALDPDAEITVECAPGQIADATLHALAACGVNRVSLGVQSFIDREAHESGRLHSRAIVERDLGRLRAAGIANLNVDLIAGLAGQTFASWEQSLAALADSAVPHASVYMLEVDEDSRLGREMLAGGARYHAGLVPGDDAIASMYERAIERLAEAGLHQYEISNFSRPGFQSRHNLRYWQRRPYLGVGLDASSMLREASSSPGSSVGRASNAAESLPDIVPGNDFRHSSNAGSSRPGTGKSRPGTEKSRPGLVSGHDFSRAEEAPKSTGALAPAYILRATTTDDLKAYLDASAPPETAWLSPARQHEEAWFLGLRLNAGVRIAELEREFGRAPVARAMETVARLAQDGLVASDGQTVRLTARGRMISNDVFQEFLDLAAEPATL